MIRVHADNPDTDKKDLWSQPCGIYPGKARLVQHAKHMRDTPCNRTRGRNLGTTPGDAEGVRGWPHSWARDRPLGGARAAPARARERTVWTEPDPAVPTRPQARGSPPCPGRGMKVEDGRGRLQGLLLPPGGQGGDALAGGQAGRAVGGNRGPRDRLARRSGRSEEGATPGPSTHGAGRRRPPGAAAAAATKPETQVSPLPGSCPRTQRRPDREPQNRGAARKQRGRKSRRLGVWQGVFKNTAKCAPWKEEPMN